MTRHFCELQRPRRRRFAIFLPCLNGGEGGHPGRNLPLYCGPKTTRAQGSTYLQNHFATPTSSLSLRLGLLFDRCLTASPASSVKVRKALLLVLFQTKTKTSIGMERQLLVSHIVQFLLESKFGKFCNCKS